MKTLLIVVTIITGLGIANAFDAKKLLKDYEYGLGFKRGDVLVPREGASPYTFGVIENKVIVLQQSPLAPHQYTVIGENPNPQSPSDRFVKFQIDGHNWDYTH